MGISLPLGTSVSGVWPVDRVRSALESQSQAWGGGNVGSAVSMLGLEKPQAEGELRCGPAVNSMEENSKLRGSQGSRSWFRGAGGIGKMGWGWRISTLACPQLSSHLPHPQLQSLQLLLFASG